MARLALCRLPGVVLALLLAAQVVAAAPAAKAPVDRFTAAPFNPDGGESGHSGEAAASSAGPSIPRIIGSLALVAGLIVGLGFAYRKLFTGQNKGGGAVTVISRQMLTPKHQVFVLRVGQRLLVVGDSGQGMQPLAEVTDPAEMSEIIGEATSVSLRADAFAATLEEVDSQYAADGDEEDEVAQRNEPPAGDLGMARTEVQSLLAKVRQLAGQQQG